MKDALIKEIEVANLLIYSNRLKELTVSLRKILDNSYDEHEDYDSSKADVIVSEIDRLTHYIKKVLYTTSEIQEG